MGPRTGKPACGHGERFVVQEHERAQTSLPAEARSGYCSRSTRSGVVTLLAGDKSAGGTRGAMESLVCAGYSESRWALPTAFERVGWDEK